MPSQRVIVPVTTLPAIIGHQEPATLANQFYKLQLNILYWEKTKHFSLPCFLSDMCDYYVLIHTFKVDFAFQPEIRVALKTITTVIYNKYCTDEKLNSYSSIAKSITMRLREAMSKVRPYLD